MHSSPTLLPSSVISLLACRFVPVVTLFLCLPNSLCSFSVVATHIALPPFSNTCKQPFQTGDDILYLQARYCSVYVGMTCYTRVLRDMFCTARILPLRFRMRAFLCSLAASYTFLMSHLCLLTTRCVTFYAHHFGSFPNNTRCSGVPYIFCLIWWCILFHQDGNGIWRHAHCASVHVYLQFYLCILPYLY